MITYIFVDKPRDLRNRCPVYLQAFLPGEGEVVAGMLENRHRLINMLSADSNPVVKKSVFQGDSFSPAIRLR